MSIRFKDINEDSEIYCEAVPDHDIVITIKSKEDSWVNDSDGNIYTSCFFPDIDTAIQFRKELQRQIMKAKALEKGGQDEKD